MFARDIVAELPDSIVVWRHYIDKNRVVRPLPPGCVVTSRETTASGKKKAHFALMCASSHQLAISEGDRFDPGAYRNATGGKVGASQVTALLRRITATNEVSAYSINMIATLTESYWVRLLDPLPLAPEKLQLLEEAMNINEKDWISLADQIKSRRDTEIDASDLFM